VSLLREWISFFPSLETFVEKVEANQPAWLFDKQCQVTADVMNMIHDITRCAYDQPYHKVYFDNQSNSLLFLLLTQAAETVVEDKVHSDVMYSIFNARTMITQNPKYHYSIPEIAAEVGLNTFRLKRGFKEVFGTGLYEYLVDDRMERARLMLEDTVKPVKEIALMVGYKNSSSFIKAFSKKFMQSPHALRLLKRKT
jgi:AraC-like DNA-binding protein